MPVNTDLTNFIAFQNRVKDVITDGLHEAGKDLHDLARQLAPEKSGQLKNSGKVVMTGPFSVEVSFGNDLPDDRAIAQEYGTAFMPAQPYLSVAIKHIDFTFHIIKKLGIK